MKIDLSCSSKTFLLGEYSILNSGSALLLSTEPRFRLIADTRGKGGCEGVHKDSPAGRWLAQNRVQYGHIDLQFVDPHKGAGGFGASSAQFLLVHALSQILRDPERAATEAHPIQVEPIWRAYRHLEMVSEEGLRPSGADLVAQFMGGLCEVSVEPFAVRAMRWPFSDVDVVLVRTGEKLPTHEHLRGLRRLDTSELAFVYDRARESVLQNDAQGFFDATNDYYAELLELGLVAEHTQVLVATLMAKPFVKAVKGCGALGNDTLAVVFASEHRDHVKAALRELGKQIVADLAGATGGFQMRVEDEDSGRDKDSSEISRE